MKSARGVTLVLIGGGLVSIKQDISHFIRLYSSLTKVFLLTTEDPMVKEPNVFNRNIDKPFKSSNFLLRALGFLICQLNIIRALRKVRKFTKIIFYHVGGTILFFPQLFSKLSGNVNITFDAGPTLRVLRHTIRLTESHAKRFSICLEYCAIRLMEWLTLHLTDMIIVFSPSMVGFGDRSSYMKKIYSANLNYVDVDAFRKETQIGERIIDLLYVGHAGKIDPEFLSSVFLILRDRKLSISFLGDSEPLKEWKKEISRFKLAGSIRFLGIKHHTKIPKYLNDAKFLILPSATEGLPKVLLEAMACGTIPIAAPVGGIPDIVRHGENGFLLSMDSPARTASQILTFINNPRLERISESAVNYIRENQTYDKIKEKYDLLYRMALPKGTCQDC